jgi:hypothetical protein
VVAKTLSFAQLIDDRPAWLPSRPVGPVDRAFAGILRDVQDLNVLKPHRMRFRPSNARPCQWAVMLSRVVQADEADSFARDFYTTIGKAAHEVVQRWLGRAGVLYGDYSCRCGRTVRSQGEPAECPECGRPSWRYQEFDLVRHDTTGLLASAKIDGLVRWPSMPADHYYLIDIKTCSLKSLPRADVGFTSEYHLHYPDQTAVYRVLLAQAGYQVDGTVFLMVPRDNPRKTTAIVVDQPDPGTTLDELVARWLAASLAGRTGDLTAIQRDCRGRLDRPDCPYHRVCWDDRATDQAFVAKIGRPPVR